MDTSASFHFSQEELAVLVELSQAGVLPGLGSQPFGALPPETVEALKIAATRSLLAHGSLQLTPQGGLVVDPALENLLSLCYYPQKLIMLLTSTSPALPASLEAYYLVENLAVQHYTPISGVHELTLREGWQPNLAGGMVERIAQYTRAVLDAAPLALPKALLEEAQRLAKETPDEARQKLLEAPACASNPAFTASAAGLVEVLAEPAFQMIFEAAADASQPPPPLAVSCSAELCFTFEKTAPTEGGEEQVTLQAVSLDSLCGKLEARLAPFFQN